MIDLDKFRADFERVFRAERLHGHANEDEAAQQRKQAGAAVQAHITDDAWMTNAAAHFADMAERIRRDEERSARIRAEVRAAKEAV